MRTGQKVYLNDTTFHATVTPVEEELKRGIDVQLHFHLQLEDPSMLFSLGFEVSEQDLALTAHTALFGGDPTISWRDGGHSNKLIRFAGPDPLVLLQPESHNRWGCQDYNSALSMETVLFVERGNCSFFQKLKMAKAAGAAGVIVASDTEDHINPTGDAREQDMASKELADVALVVIPRSGAQMINELLGHAHFSGLQLLMSVDHQPSPQTTTGKRPSSTRYLYVNNRPLINVELLV